MPTFTAKEKGTNDQPKPGDSVPVADEDGIRELGAHEFYPRHWEYRHREHTLTDLMRPGYFEGEARARLNVGDEIHYCMQGGSKTPSEWVRGICVVEEKPNMKELPLILAGYVEFEQPKAWRDEKPKTA